MHRGIIRITPFINNNILIIDKNMRKLCVKPYYNHKKGCPNFGKKKGCPPSCKNLDKILDFNKDIFLIFNKFKFEEHVNRMRNKHPDWSKRQLECCLYWQRTARKELKKVINIVKDIYPNLFTVHCPEASGVNITGTMKNIDIELEWPPKKYTYQVVLSGTKVKDF